MDFGRELYTPWRLAEGAVLYRDVDSFYGPLSQYINGTVFALFGPSLMTLVTVNLLVFGAIIALVYFGFRRAWGVLAGFVGSALFISVFGFSQHVRGGNYNYATPYAHETTHGVLVCLLLVAVLARWVEQPTLRRSVVVGFLGGLTAILKPEIMLAAALVMGTAVVLHLLASGLAARGGLGRAGGRSSAAVALFSRLFPAAFAGGRSAGGHG